MHTEQLLHFGPFSYPYYLTDGNLSDLFQPLLNLPDVDRFVVLADTKCRALFAAQIQEILSECCPCHVLTFNLKEKSKTLATLEALSEEALSLMVTRASCIVALGGGISGNMAGMLAATLFRGIRLVHVPTSLMSMLDSVLSLKQAINSSKGKNLIGVFHPPTMVLTCLRFLESLERLEVISGLCEVVKNLLAIDPQGIDEVASHFNPSTEYSSRDYERFILHSIAMKQRVMETDPFEKETGIVLEYGHTIGHAIEIVSSGSVSHGLAVGLGMLCAARISRDIGHLSDRELDLHTALLETIGAPTRLPQYIDVSDIMRALSFDNKRGYLPEKTGSVNLVILESLGAPIWTGGKPMIPVPEAAVVAALEHIK